MANEDSNARQNIGEKLPETAFTSSRLFIDALMGLIPEGRCGEKLSLKNAKINTSSNFWPGQNSDARQNIGEILTETNSTGMKMLIGTLMGVLQPVVVAKTGFDYLGLCFSKFGNFGLWGFQCKTRHQWWLNLKTFDWDDLTTTIKKPQGGKLFFCRNMNIAENHCC